MAIGALLATLATTGIHQQNAASSLLLLAIMVKFFPLTRNLASTLPAPVAGFTAKILPAALRNSLAAQLATNWSPSSAFQTHTTFGLKPLALSFTRLGMANLAIERASVDFC